MDVNLNVDFTDKLLSMIKPGAKHLKFLLPILLMVTIATPQVVGTEEKNATTLTKSIRELGDKADIIVICEFAIFKKENSNFKYVPKTAIFKPLTFLKGQQFSHNIKVAIEKKKNENANSKTEEMDRYSRWILFLVKGDDDNTYKTVKSFKGILKQTSLNMRKVTSVYPEPPPISVPKFSLESLNENGEDIKQLRKDFEYRKPPGRSSLYTPIIFLQNGDNVDINREQIKLKYGEKYTH